MTHLLLSRNICAGLLVASVSLSACSSIGRAPGDPGPQRQGEVAEAPPTAPVAQQLPTALQRSAYDAPDWGTQQQAQSATRPAAAPTVRQPSAQRPVTAGAAPGAVYGQQSYNAPVVTGGVDAMQAQDMAANRAPRAGWYNPQTSAPQQAATATAAPATTRMEASASTPATQVPVPREAPAPARARTATAADTSGTFAVHLASYRLEENVARGWETFKSDYPQVLNRLEARGARISINGKGDYIRLLVGPFQSPRDARALCTELKSLDEYCNVMPFEGALITS